MAQKYSIPMTYSIYILLIFKLKMYYLFVSSLELDIKAPEISMGSLDILYRPVVNSYDQSISAHNTCCNEMVQNRQLHLDKIEFERQCNLSLTIQAICFPVQILLNNYDQQLHLVG